MKYKVYVVENIVNKKKYIGYTSKSLSVRWEWHCTRKNCRKLRYAIDKYGASNFTITELYVTSTMEDALKAEYELIKVYDTLKVGYNLTEGGRSPKLSEDSKRKMSMSRMGIFKGRVISEEHKRKISKTRIEKGIKPSREAILKGLETRKRNNKPLPVDFGKKISERQLGKNNPSAKTVRCIQTSEVFDTVKDAAEMYGLNKNCVSHNLNKRNKSVGRLKLTFEYVD